MDGDDGAKGMLEMKESGAYTIAQDEESCVVYGMPKKAIELNAVDQVLALKEIPAAVLKEYNQN
jgi:two-component system chemotaxis response regulator CheB